MLTSLPRIEIDVSGDIQHGLISDSFHSIIMINKSSKFSQNKAHLSKPSLIGVTKMQNKPTYMHSLTSATLVK